MIHQMDKEDMVFRVFVDERLPVEMCGDKERIEQILYNLILNALKFTQKGFVKLKVMYSKHQGQPGIRFEVIDTGIGIDKEKIAKIFNVFGKGRGNTTKDISENKLRSCK